MNKKGIFLTILLTAPCVLFIVMIIIIPIGGFNPSSSTYKSWYKALFYSSLYGMIISAAIALIRMERADKNHKTNSNNLKIN